MSTQKRHEHSSISIGHLDCERVDKRADQRFTCVVCGRLKGCGNVLLSANYGLMSGRLPDSGVGISQKLDHLVERPSRNL
jgi:hypothetical protein